MLFAGFVRTGVVSRGIAAMAFVVVIDMFPEIEQWVRAALTL